MDLFKLLGTIAIDGSEAKKELDDVSDKGGKTESKLSKAFSTIGKGAAVVGKAIGTGMVVAGTAMGALTVKALNLSGELEQNMGGSEQVFGKYAGKMQETAKAAFSNMGLSTSDFLATANKMGALFQGAGFSIKESSDLSASAMQRAADVASIMGIDTSAAMEAIAGAAKGNFTMMDNLGVAMNDTTLEAYALSKGIDKATKDMTNQEKIGLAMEMFMEKTAYAAGNYARENETLAGSLGTAKAALTNFLDGSGSVEDLVTSFSSLANVVVKNVKEIAPRLVSGVIDIANQIVPMIPSLFQQLLPVIISGAVSLINGLIDMLPSLVSLITETLLPSLISGLVTIVTTLVGKLPSVIQTLVSALPSLIPQLINALVSIIVTICENFNDIIMPIIDALPGIIISIVSALCSNLGILIDGIITLILGIVDAIPVLLEGLIGAIPTIIELLLTAILSNLPKIIAGLIKVVISIVKKLPQIIGLLIQGIVNTLKGIWAALENVFGMLGDWFKKKFGGGVDAIKEVFGKIGDWFKEKWNAIKKVFSNVGEWFKEKFQSAVSKIKNVFGSISSWFSNVKNKITSAFSNIKEKISQPFEKARDVIKGVVDKIKGFFNSLKLKLPKIKLPHFKVTGKLSISPPSVPKLSIDWYKKAMNNPMIMNDPTIFGYNPKTGSFMGGGEAGSEVVSGTNTLMGMIRSAVSGEIGALTYYMQQLVNMLADYFPQVLELQAAGHVIEMDGKRTAHILAKPMDAELGKIQKDKERGK